MPRVSAALPPRAGVGLKPEHARDIFAVRPDLGFFEVHAENYMGAGGPPHRLLEAIRADYPLSIHGVGLSIGGDGPLDRAHLKRLRTLIDRYEPGRFSEHLAWSSHGTEHLPDLLPLPLTEETLSTVIAHVNEVQEALGLTMLLENPSTYVGFEASSIPEVAFLEEVAACTGCGLLLDVNNVVVSAANHGFDARDYLTRFPMDRVGEIHLAGHDEAIDATGERFLIDAHGSPTTDEVWTLYAETIARAGPVPTLIEWDNDVPAFDVLYDEARRAERILFDERRRRNRLEVRHVALV